MEDIRKRVWNALLDSELNCRYLGYLISRYHQRDICSKIFLACMTSGTVGTWIIWNDPAKYPYGVVAWKILSAFSALLSIALPILNYGKKVSAASRLRWEHCEIQSQYDVLWLKLPRIPSPNQCINELSKIAKKEAALARHEDNLPLNNHKLIRKCQSEVLTARGLKPKT
jgi:hypothetical protein